MEGSTRNGKEIKVMSEEMIDKAVGRINKAWDKLCAEGREPWGVVGLFSGGHDSLTATYIASKCDQFKCVLHINTGIGIEATRQFVRDTCDEQGWPLMEYKAMEHVDKDGNPAPQDFDQFCLQNGFPGPFLHTKMYNRLKERQLNRFAKDNGIKPKQPVIFVSGCRSQESTRRMANTEEHQDMGKFQWVAAIHDFTKIDCNHIIKEAGLKRNLIVDPIHKSGECLCGAFAKPGELEELKMWPQTRPAYERIKALEKEVMKKFPWSWEEEPPVWWQEKKQGQSFMFNYDQPLCWSCNKRNEESKS
jgi:3'-phosphoadenosine 5'-phosphosulfate sulfotransferase (PAPS reductase)/FAD synthetase